MAYAATVFNVLIASPSDVPNERNAIAQSIHDWNALHSKDTGKVLLPVMWESHSAPSMSDRPQGVINSQLVQGCDMLIGAFWMRLGSPTGVAQSGTVEEIDYFRKTNKPVMLYFSKVPLDQSSLDIKQYEELQNYKKSLKSKGLLEEYASVADLSEKLHRQLTINIREMNVQTVVDPKAVRLAIKQSEKPLKSEANPDQEISADVTNGVKLMEYTEKSFLVVGNTLAVKDDLKEAGGKWIKGKAGASGWCFSKRNLEKVAVLLRIPPTLSK